MFSAVSWSDDWHQHKISVQSVLFSQVLIQLLQGKDSNHAKNTASRMSAEQRQAQLKILRNQRMNWRDNTPEYMHTRREVQIKILQEGKFQLDISEGYTDLESYIVFFIWRRELFWWNQSVLA